MRGMNIVTQGGDQLMQVLDLLADPKKFKKALDEMKAEEAHLQEQIELAGVANEIVTLRGRMEHELENAREEGTKLCEEAKRTLEKAMEKAERTIAKAQSEAADMTESAQTALTDAQRRLTASQEQLADNQRAAHALTQREQQIQNQEKSLENRIAEIDKIETQLLKEKSKLATVSETLKQAVG